MLLNVGAKRVSQPAIDAFTDIITSRAEHIAAKSIQIAKHSGRKTVQGEDIKLAVK
jgi:histone H3/H4|tara:strand:+ start:1289 stop:1456 length:168 start_codon:yes stop_codon:yes gene_type:complete